MQVFIKAIKWHILTVAISVKHLNEFHDVTRFKTDFFQSILKLGSLNETGLSEFKNLWHSQVLLTHEIDKFEDFNGRALACLFLD